MAEKTCVRCGMPDSQWTGSGGVGVKSGGQTYCCQGCAENTGCTCQQDAKILR